MLSIKQIVFLTSLIFLFSFKGICNDPIKTKLYSLYNFNIFEHDRSSYSGIEGTLIKACEGWYKFLLNPANTEIADQTLANIDQYFAMADSIAITAELSLNQIFLQQYKVRIHAFRRDQIKALNANLALGKMIDNIQPDKLTTEYFAYYRFVSSAYNYVDSYFQENNLFYSIISSNEIFDRGTMLRDIEDYYRTGDSFIKTESAYFLMKAYSEIEGDYRTALNYSGWLVNNYPQNIIFQVEHYKCLASSGIDFDKLRQEKSNLVELISESKMTKEQKIHIETVVNSYDEQPCRKL